MFRFPRIRLCALVLESVSIKDAEVTRGALGVASNVDVLSNPDVLSERVLEFARKLGDVPSVEDLVTLETVSPVVEDTELSTYILADEVTTVSERVLLIVNVVIEAVILLTNEAVVPEDVLLVEDVYVSKLILVSESTRLPRGVLFFDIWLFVIELKMSDAELGPGDVSLVLSVLAEDDAMLSNVVLHSIDVLFVQELLRPK